MKEDTANDYAERIWRVIDYVNANLGKELRVEHLARIAGFSKFHFHRQFTSYAGVSVSRLVRLLRLKQASYQLAFDANAPIIDIAFEAGFENPESFSRAFKKAQGQTPSQFRAKPDWNDWAKQYQFPLPPRRNTMSVKIVKFLEEKVAVLEHIGAPETINTSVAKFIEWRKSNSLSPNASSNTYGVPYSDPAETKPEEFHFDICGTVKEDVPSNPQGVIHKFIPGGRCAVVRHHGSTDTISDTVLPLYSEWLPNSGEELRDFPVYFHYISRMPTVAEHEQITDVYLPLKG
tara:strand:- start:74605 stop:75474 length:870 start_codon:yes stop_codon:yes gene_type:complete